MVKNSDSGIINVSKEFREGILDGRSSRGMCFAVSSALASYLRVFHSIDCECVSTDLSDDENSEWLEHYWIMMPDGRALDPTYDQFDGKPVYLGPPVAGVHTHG